MKKMHMLSSNAEQFSRYDKDLSAEEQPAPATKYALL